MNLFKDLPCDLSEEVFEDLLTHKQLRVERIVSKGQTTPEGEWYDQEGHEWVLVLQGAGELTYEDGSVKRLEAAITSIFQPIPSTGELDDPEQETIWLAVFYS